MTLADWIIGFAFGFGVILCGLGLWRALCDNIEQAARLDLRIPPDTSTTVTAPRTSNPCQIFPVPERAVTFTSPDWAATFTASEQGEQPDTVTEPDR